MSLPSLHYSTLPVLLTACEDLLPPVSCGPIDRMGNIWPGGTLTRAACFTDPNGDVLAYPANAPAMASAVVSVSA